MNFLDDCYTNISPILSAYYKVFSINFIIIGSLALCKSIFRISLIIIRLYYVKAQNKYNKSPVKRGEIFLDFDVIDNANTERANRNQRKEIESSCVQNHWSNYLIEC